MSDRLLPDGSGTRGGLPPAHAVTINVNNVPKGPITEITKDCYKSFIEGMRKSGALSHINFEVGAQGRTHLHCIWHTRLDQKQRHKILRKRGSVYTCDHLYNEQGWINYMAKGTSL